MFFWKLISCTEVAQIPYISRAWSQNEKAMTDEDSGVDQDVAVDRCAWRARRRFVVVRPELAGTNLARKRRAVGAITLRGALQMMAGSQCLSPCKWQAVSAVCYYLAVPFSFAKGTIRRNVVGGHTIRLEDTRTAVHRPLGAVRD